MSAEAKFDKIKQVDLNRVAVNRYVFEKTGLAKLQAREILKDSIYGLSELQIKKALKCLGEGKATVVNLKLDKICNLKLSMERPGHTSGFQRMSYKINSNGEKRPIVQTAFDDYLNLVRQKGNSEGKNILFDVKKPRKSK